MAAPVGTVMAALAYIACVVKKLEVGQFQAQLTGSAFAAHDGHISNLPTVQTEWSAANRSQRSDRRGTGVACQVVRARAQMPSASPNPHDGTS